MDREFLVDLNPDAKLPEYELILCKMNAESLQSLKNITDFEIRPYFADIDEISFSVPLYRTSNDGDPVRNELFDLIDGNMLVLVNEMKYFILVKPKIVSNKDTGETYKEIMGFSREYEFSKKQITGYHGVSRKIYDSSNQVDENGLEVGFLNYVEKKTSWTVGYVNYDLTLKYRELNFPKLNMLQAFKDVQRTFGCLFQFDTMNKVINVYDATQLGVNQGLYISDRNFIRKITQDINDDEIVTRLYLYGKDNISIQKLNITGQPWIQNLEYFKNTKFMSQGLIDALDGYDAYVLSKDGLFNGYLSSLDTLNATLSTKKLELSALYSELKTIEVNLDLAISSGLPTVDILNQQTAKHAEITTKQAEVDGVQAQVDSVHSDINALGDDLGMNNHFTLEQLKELDPFIREDDYIDSNYTEETLSDLFEEGQKILNEVSYPKAQVPIEVNDFFGLVEGQHFKSRFVMGDLISVGDKDTGIDMELRLIGYTHKPDNNKLSLVFSNQNNVDGANDFLSELQESVTTTAGTVDFSKYKWDKGEEAKSQIEQYIDSALDLSKQQILKAVGQKPMVDDRGIWMVKQNPDGSIDPEQLRIINNAIALSVDNWAGTPEVAISATNGINANLIRGKLGEFALVKADQIDVTEGKIQTAQIEDLVVGGNVTMGEDATISWGQVLEAPPIPDLPGYITPTKITSTTIESPTISAGIITGALFKTASSNQRMELSSDGLKSYNNYNQLDGVSILPSDSFGKVTFNSGFPPYSSSTTYTRGDRVSYNSRGYINTSRSGTLGIAPTNTLYWEEIVPYGQPLTTLESEFGEIIDDITWSSSRTLVGIKSYGKHIELYASGTANTAGDVQIIAPYGELYVETDNGINAFCNNHIRFHSGAGTIELDSDSEVLLRGASTINTATGDLILKADDGANSIKMEADRVFFNGSSVHSDIKLKENINKIPNELFKVSDSIDLLTYNFKNKKEKENVGVIAQYVEQAFLNNGLDPNNYEFVQDVEDKDTNEITKYVNYTEIMLLKIASLERKVEILQERVG